MNLQHPMHDAPDSGAATSGSDSRIPAAVQDELSRIAHDLNNALLVVRGHASVLRSTLADEQQLSDVDEIVAAADRATALARELSAISRGRGAKTEPA